MAAVMVGPYDIHAGARRHAYLDVGRFLSRIEWDRHFSIMAAAIAAAKH
jgi:hypothetical protein